MILLDYAALRATPVADEPFPHVVVPHFVPPDALRAVVADLPPLGKRGSFPVTGVALGPVARSLMAELEGDALRAAIAEKFALDLADAPTMLTLRAWTTERDGQHPLRFHRQARHRAAVPEPGRRCLGPARGLPAPAAWPRRPGGLRRRGAPGERHAAGVSQFARSPGTATRCSPASATACNSTT